MSVLMTHEEAYPEHHALSKVKDASEAIGFFLEATRYTLCELVPVGRSSREWAPARKSIEKLLAEHFDINLQRLNDEKAAMLRSIRWQP